jgi:hypothetical protein
MLNVASFFGCFFCANAGREAKTIERCATRLLTILRLMRMRFDPLLKSCRSRETSLSKVHR